MKHNQFSFVDNMSLEYLKKYNEKLNLRITELYRLKRYIAKRLKELQK